MLNPALDKQFAGSIPHLHQTHLVPVIFAPYAVDMAGCLQERKLERVLEVAMRVAAEVLWTRFGAGPLEGKIQAQVVTVEY